MSKKSTEKWSELSVATGQKMSERLSEKSSNKLLKKKSLHVPQVLQLHLE